MSKLPTFLKEAFLTLATVLVKAVFMSACMSFSLLTFIFAALTNAYIGDTGAFVLALAVCAVNTYLAIPLARSVLPKIQFANNFLTDRGLFGLRSDVAMTAVLTALPGLSTLALVVSRLVFGV